MTKKRILAITALVFMACLYGAALVLALIDSPTARSCLMAALFCTIVLPPALYGFLLFTGRTDKKQEEPTDPEG